ncbi:MAG: acyl-ACP--UDP-N-acetylglucosamine O-acyltransferase [Bdellovibrio sp.]|nr:MAG: acyl-ACP--UDP-N-acetylglucosamine O-acyltransferase [Bdellovibrio sp.]
MAIHPTAIIDSRAKVHPTTEIGPFCVIKGKVTLGPCNKLESHVSIGTEEGEVIIGEGNHFWQGAVLGGAPQDLKYKGEPTKLVIGNHNVIREYVTVNLGTVTGGGVTTIGDHCLLMAYVHVAHDCHFHNHVVVANSTQFAGHVIVEDHVHFGGVCAVTQFCKIGKFAFIGGDSVINKDILPFSIAQGRWAKMKAANRIGLERKGFQKEEIENIYKALRILLKGESTTSAAVERIQNECVQDEHILYLLKFIEESERGLAK